MTCGENKKRLYISIYSTKRTWSFTRNW